LIKAIINGKREYKPTFGAKIASYKSFETKKGTNITSNTAMYNKSLDFIFLLANIKEFFYKKKLLIMPAAIPQENNYRGKKIISLYR